MGREVRRENKFCGGCGGALRESGGRGSCGGREWTGGAGYHRIYFNNLPELYGLRVSRYKTGSISSASFRGGKISNNKARRIGQAFAFSKLWYDVGSRKFECKGMDEEDKAWIVAEIKKRAKI